MGDAATTNWWADAYGGWVDVDGTDEQFMAALFSVAERIRVPSYELDEWRFYMSADVWEKYKRFVDVESPTSPRGYHFCSVRIWLGLPLESGMVAWALGRGLNPHISALAPVSPATP